MPASDELIQEMVGAIVRAINPRQIILFGSHARGLREGRTVYERP